MSNYLIKFIEDIDKRLNFNKEVKLFHGIDGKTRFQMGNR